MDDTFLLQRRLDELAAGYSVELVPREYTVTKTLVLDFTAPVSDLWLFGHGAVLRSAITDGSPVLVINVSARNAWVRRVNFLDFTIFGTPGTGHGVQIYATGQDNGLFHMGFERVAVEGVGGNGWNILGAIFESEWRSCAAEACGLNGVVMGHTADGKGILSAIRWHGGGRSIRANAKVGLAVVNVAYDVHVSDTYFLLNGGPGCDFSNGIRKISDCGFENNQTATGGPAITGQSFGTFDGCAATPPAAGGKQTSLLAFYVAPGCPLSLRDCAGGGTVTGDNRLVTASGLQGAWTGLPGLKALP